MKRNFVTNLVLVITLNLLVKPFWIFGIDRTVQNVVGADIYGLYFSLFSFSVILNILLDLGITNYNNRNIARNPDSLASSFSSIVALKFLLAVFYAAVCIGIGFIVGYRGEHFRILWILLLNQFLALFILYLRSNISGLHFFRTDSILSVLDRTLVIIICGALLWGNITEKPFRIEWYIFSQTAAYTITALVAFIIVLLRAGAFRPRLDLAKFREILKESYPFAILILLMFFYFRIDSFLLERMLPDGNVQVGIYAQSFRILDAAYMFATLFAGLLLPIFARMLKKKEPVGEMVNTSLTLIGLPSILLAATGIFYSGEIINLLYNEHLEESSGIFPLLMISFSGIAISHIYGTLLTANRNLKALNLLAATAIIVNLVLNFMLIPTHKAYGSAIASLGTSLYMAAGQILIAHRQIRIGFSTGFSLRLFLSIPLILAGAYLSKELIGNWLVGLGILCIWTGIVAFVLKLIRLQDLRKLIYQD